MDRIAYECLPGYHINEAVKNMVALADEKRCVVVTAFNGTPIEVSPGSNVEGVVKKWGEDRERARREYEASPQYAEDQRKAREEAEQREAQREAGVAAFLTVLRDGDERALREAEVPRVHTGEELLSIVRAAQGREHDYGTCVYAMSISAVAAFNYIAHELGVTGFQASCADMDILRRTRGMKHGFQVLDYENLLYPQYRDKFDRLTWWELIDDNMGRLRESAQKLLAEFPDASPYVRSHWETLAALPVQESA